MRTTAGALEGGLRRIYAGLPAERVEHYLRRFSALTAALNWYRAMRPPAVRGPASVPTMYVWRTGDEFIGPAAWNDEPTTFPLQVLPVSRVVSADGSAEAT
jgi:hypothetical protein